MNKKIVALCLIAIIAVTVGALLTSQNKKTSPPGLKGGEERLKFSAKELTQALLKNPQLLKEGQEIEVTDIRIEMFVKKEYNDIYFAEPLVVEGEEVILELWIHKGNIWGRYYWYFPIENAIAYNARDNEEIAVFVGKDSVAHIKANYAWVFNGHEYLDIPPEKKVICLSSVIFYSDTTPPPGKLAELQEYFWQKWERWKKWGERPVEPTNLFPNLFPENS